MKATKGSWVLIFLMHVAIVGILMESALGQARNRRLDSDEQANISLFHRTSPSVVNICTKEALTRRSAGPSLNLDLVSAGVGSGFVWDKQGHIITNYHVVRDADVMRVTLGDGSAWNAEVVGTAPDADVTVLRIEAPDERLSPLAVGESHDLAVGQKVYAIGNPFGLDHTLTMGIISGLGRQIRSQSGDLIEDVIQTDAAINPGNSGGPLLNSQGRLVGMNTAILSPSGSSAGVGFAVPVDSIQQLVPDLIRFGRSKRPALGLVLAPLNISRGLGIDGLLVLRVAPGGPAAESGLQPSRNDNGNLILGDVIVSLEGQPVRKPSDLVQRLRGHQAGDVITLGIRRADEFVRINIRLRNL